MAEEAQELTASESDEVIVHEEEEVVHEELPPNVKMEESTIEQGRVWPRILGAKRPYPEEELEDDIGHHYSQPSYASRMSDSTRRRGRPKKFPSGTIPPHYLPRMPDKPMETQMQSVEYVDEHQPPQQPPPPPGARILSLTPRIIEHPPGRGPFSRPAPPVMVGSIGASRLSQSGPLRVTGSAAQIASARLPTLTGAPPKENKPLKVVTLLPNSRRQGDGPPRPLVSSVRPLGPPAQQKTNKIPQMSIEKQAEIIINQTVKQADQLVIGQSIGEFNKIVDMLNAQILVLQEDNKRLNTMYTGLVDFKDNRIKELETQVEKLQNEVNVAIKNWHTQLIVAETEAKQPQQVVQNVVQMHHPLDTRRGRIAQVTAEGEWIIDDQSDPNGEMHGEIIEEEVDEETFLRMQQEMQASEELIMHQHVEEEVVVSNDDADHHQMA